MGGGRRAALLGFGVVFVGAIIGALYMKATGDWNLVFLLFAGMLVAGAICWAVLNPKGTLFDE